MSTIEKILLKNQKALGRKIREIRLNKKLSQLDVASRCKFEKTTISRIENGRTNVTLKTLTVLAFVLEVEIKDFFDYN